ncbi:MAG: hypothetical protein ACKOE6_09470, partial [Flammeovirgaceae bacterium]
QEKTEKSFQLSFLGIDAAAEGPFKKGKKASYLANYRYSTVGVLVDIGALPSGVAPTYQDFSFNLAFPLAAGAVNVWAVIGDGVFNEKFSSGGKNYLNTTSLIGGVTLTNSVNKSTAVTTTVSATHVHDNYFSSQIVNNILTETFWTKNSGLSLRVSTQLNKKLSPRSLLRSGLILSYRDYEIGQRYIDFADNRKLKTPYGSEGVTQYAQAYVQWKKVMGDKFTLNAGLHGIYVLHNRRYSVEPRLGLSYQVSESGSLAAAVGLHSRLQPLMLYDQMFVQPDGTISYLNRNLDLSRSLHYQFSYNRQINTSLRARAEFYYQSLFRIPVYYSGSGSAYATSFSALNVFGEYLGRTQNIDAIQLANKGTGENYGLELSLDKKFSKNHYFLFTATLYRSHYKGADGVTRNTSFNGQHIVTALAGKEYRTGVRKSNIVELSARVSWAGNNPQTPIDIASSLKQSAQVYDYSRSYESVLPNYFRLDVHVGFRKSRPKAAHIWSLDFRNFTNQQNPRYEYLNFNTQTIGYEYQLGFIPVLSYRIEF